VSVRVIHGDCLAVMGSMDEASVDAIVTDPPYLLEFMGKEFDRQHKGMDGANAGEKMQAWHLSWAREAYRVLRPGGHLLAFGGTRTGHRLAAAIEDAGFEIRDQIINYHDSTRNERAFLDSLSEEQQRALVAVVDDRSPLGQVFWNFGQGFPKSRDVSKAIDEEAGVERERLSTYDSRSRDGCARQTAPSKSAGYGFAQKGGIAVTAPSTDAAREWAGWGTALKPAHEPLVLARKPLGASTVAANVLAHGTGALNIDGCRVPAESGDKGEWPVTSRTERRGSMAGPLSAVQTDHSSGRWPANVIHDGSDEVEAAFAAFGERKVGKLSPHHKRGEQVNCYGKSNGAPPSRDFGGDTGTASRFFYCAKAGRSERWKHVVCRCSAQVIPPTHVVYKLKHCPVCGDEFKVTAHPTQKPESLMRYLCRLIMPPGGTVLDMFAGSGSTGCAALAEGFGFVGIEADEIYAAIAEARIAAARVGPKDRPKARAKTKAEVQPSPTPDLFSLAAE
jgi:DNA modification methylase